MTKLDRDDGEVIIKLVLAALQGGADELVVERLVARVEERVPTFENEVAAFLRGAEATMRTEVHGAPDGVPPPPTAVVLAPSQIQTIAAIAAATMRESKK